MLLFLIVGELSPAWDDNALMENHCSKSESALHVVDICVYSIIQLYAYSVSVFGVPVSLLSHKLLFLSIDGRHLRYTYSLGVWSSRFGLCEGLAYNGCPRMIESA